MALYVTEKKRGKRIAFYIIAFLLLLTTAFFLFVNRIIEPILRQRLHTLIISGSDSLYQYRLGSLEANFLGGSVEVKDLHIKVDSSRYLKMAAAHALPSLTLQLHLQSGQIKGIGLIALLFEKKITIEEIVSTSADIVLLRHIKEDDAPKNTEPLWKAIQPSIKSIAIKKVDLDGVKLLYKNADTTHAVKLQFDKCVGLFKDIQIDSLASIDTARIGFTRSIFMQFNDLKFRTPDSSYKMKAGNIVYSSEAQTLVMDSFKLQPTLKEKEDFYKAAALQKTMNVVELDRVKLTGFRLDHFINNNIIAADSVFMLRPAVSIYKDKTYPPETESKIGRYPHQLLLQAASTVIVNSIIVQGAALTYIEKAEKTAREGTFVMSDMDIQISNVTNDSNRIKQNALCKINATGKLLQSSPFSLSFSFFLDSAEGQFGAEGWVKNVSANELNTLVEPLTNNRLQSFNMQQINFSVKGDNYSASSDVRMRYDHLFVLLRKMDEETVAVKTKKFLTKILNKFTLYDANPEPGGIERTAVNASGVRLSSQGFFGLIWKAIFAGMQNIMMKSGRYD